MFKRQLSVEPVMMIVGLGNPGPQYAGTRHNVGFEVIDELAKRHKIKVNKSQSKALIGVGHVASEPVILVKPLTYMNLSGQAVAPLLKKNKIPLDKLIVVADDLDLATGRMRIRPGGSSGGHNGHKSLAQLLGTTEYARLKIGVGRPGDDTIDHVLGKFDAEEKTDVRATIIRAADAIEVWIDEGLERMMNQFNST